ncbi:SPW repeat protein [Nocardia wallacei]|uniref:SPW repeat protein n=1 Tax=Nocardia wallacei TaxID=480035 RepID=UPI002458D4C6|nr:SPW repeat protein [Nocardia wallacei]
MADYPQEAAAQTPRTGTADGKLGGPSASTVNGLVLLAGLFTAITPWVFADFADAPRLVVSNLILGIGVAIIGLVLTLLPARGYASSWVLIPIGAWEILTPWIVGPDITTIVWVNVWMGGIITVLGLAAAGLLVNAFAGLGRPQLGGRRLAHR